MATYTNPTIDQEISPKQVFYPDNKVAIFTCNGSPEGVILASTGSIALSDNGSVYKKTTDDINTGWIELQSGAISSPAVITGANPTLTFDDTTGGESDGSISLNANVLSLSIAGGTALQLDSAGRLSSTFPFPQHMYLDFNSATIVANTTTETSVLGTGDAGSTLTIPANLARVGTTFQLDFAGLLQDTATPTLTLRLKLDGTTIYSIPAVLITITGQVVWSLSLIASVTVAGAGGSISVFPAGFQYAASANGAIQNGGQQAITATAIDFSVAQAFTLTAQWSAASPSNSFTYNTGSIKIIRP